MKNISITIFEGGDLIKIAAALININHPIPEQGENALNSKDEAIK